VHATFPTVFCFCFVVLRQRAEEVANLERELRELQITAKRLVERRNQSQKHFEESECRLQKQQEGIKISLFASFRMPDQLFADTQTPRLPEQLSPQ